MLYSDGRFFYSNDFFSSDKRETFLETSFSPPVEQLESKPWHDVNHEILIGLIRDPYFSGLYSNP